MVAPFSLAVWLLAILAPVALADGATYGRVIVHADHVMPGETARLTGADLDEGPVVLRLEGATRTAAAGEGIVAPDGTLDATLAVPADFPTGYTTLAVEGEGVEWSTVVLIGPRAEGPGNPDAAPSPAIDERAIALVVFGLGIVVFAVAGIRYLRS